MAWDLQAEQRWRDGVSSGAFGVWDLHPQLEAVSYPPAWKRRLGFHSEDAPDSTSFWRCRVHPDDLYPMLSAMRAHLEGQTPLYEATFRVRGNGAGYRTMLSRGRVVERDAAGRGTRMVGTLVDITARPAPLNVPLAATEPAVQARSVTGRPFHAWLEPLAAAADPKDKLARAALLGQVADLLDQAIADAHALEGRTG